MTCRKYSDKTRQYTDYFLASPAVAMQMHMGDDDTDDSDDDEPMNHAASPGMFSTHASPYAYASPAAAPSPEDVKPSTSQLGVMSPSAPAYGERLPWMTDDQGLVPPSAAPSPYDQKPRRDDSEDDEGEDGMDIDPQLTGTRAESDTGSEQEQKVELTFEEKMQLRFPAFDKKKPLRFTELQAIDPIRESKKRRLEDHGSEYRKACMQLTSPEPAPDGTPLDLSRSVSSIEAEHPHPSQESSFLRPLPVVESLNQRRVHAWTAPLLRRGRKRSDGHTPAGTVTQNRMHRLIKQVSRLRAQVIVSLPRTYTREMFPYGSSIRRHCESLHLRIKTSCGNRKMLRCSSSRVGRTKSSGASSELHVVHCQGYGRFSLTL